MHADFRVDFHVRVAEVKLGGEGAVLVLEHSITNSSHMAQTGDLGVLDIGLTVNLEVAHLSVDIHLVLGNDQWVKVLLGLQRGHNLVNKLVGLAIVGVG